MSSVPNYEEIVNLGLGRSIHHMIDSFSILADLDINGTVIWIVIVVGIAIVNYLRQTFKKIGGDNGPEEGDHSSQAEKVRRLIEDMKRGQQTQPASSQSRPAYPEPAKSNFPPMVKHASSESRRTPPSVVESDARTSMTGAFDVMKAAENSMNSLSDAERKALENLKSGKTSVPSKRKATPVVARIPLSNLAAGLRNRDALRIAVVYREILGEPTSLRKHVERPGF